MRDDAPNLSAPGRRLHALLGFRPLLMQTTAFENNIYVKGVNTAYTLLILSFIVLGYVLQHASCYRQDGFRPYRESTPADTKPGAAAHSTYMTTFMKSALQNNSHHSVNSISSLNDTDQMYTDYYGNGETAATTAEMDTINTRVVPAALFAARIPAVAAKNNLSMSDETLKCRGNFFAMYLIPDVLHFFAYLFILHLMRTPESERLENLMERGFLQTSRTTGMRARRATDSAPLTFSAHRLVSRAPEIGSGAALFSLDMCKCGYAFLCAGTHTSS